MLIIGANGAGKSTLLRTISGLVKPVNGRVEFLGEPLPKKPKKIVAKGILHAIYGDWTLAIAAYNCGPGNVNKALARSGGGRTFWDIYDYLPYPARRFEVA